MLSPSVGWGWMGADVHCIGTHLNRQGHLANRVSGMRADHAATQDLAVAVSVGPAIKRQFGDAHIAAVSNGAAARRPLSADGAARSQTNSNLGACD